MKKLILLIAIIIAGYSFVHGQKDITGKVTNKKDGAPLAGVSVIVKNGGTATQTDLNGNFSLKNVPGNTKIIFSLVSYKTIESVQPSGNTMSISMEENTQQLSEVVVTALGIKREKKALGYAVSTVDKKLLEARPEPDVARLLTGKAPGVDVLATSGISGSGTNIQIRGANSITGTSDPLFVIDGAPFNGSTNQQSDEIYGSQTSSRFLDIDPNNIENISILKGLSATVLTATLVEME